MITKKKQEKSNTFTTELMLITYSRPHSERDLFKMTSSNQKQTSVQNQECQQSTFTGYYRQVVFVVLLQCHPVHKRVKVVVELHRT